MRGMWVRFRAAEAAAVAVALVLSLASSAAADSGSDRLRAARAAAARLHAQAARQQATAEVAQARLLQLSDTANAALAAYEQAKAATATARLVLADEQSKLDAARAATDLAREHVGDYARDAYIAGPTGNSLGPIIAVLRNGDPTEAFTSLTLLGKVGGAVGLVLDGVRAAQRDQVSATQAAASAFAAVQGAERQQAAAKNSAEAAVAGQAVLLRQVRARATATAAAARVADSTAARLKRELDAEIAAARARAAAARAGTGARCAGGDISAYPNGQIPIEKLCPLYGAPGEELRADAAARFNAMSHGYQSSFGAPMCVADSYRTYERQQQLYASEPGYAAYPGTSEHGWARAIDLCGGIQSDGTPQNTWMRTHAAQYGWFHPTWAEPGGGGPYEPWHWEFSG